MSNTDIEEAASRPKYSSRRNPMHERSFQILKWNEEYYEYLPFGDYTVVDENEDPELSEKRVMNLISAFNERQNLMELGGEMKSRSYFHVVPGKDENGRTKVIFYTNTEGGVSKENAVFTFEGNADDDL